MSNINHLLNRFHGWFPQDPKVKVTNAASDGVLVGRFELEKGTYVPILGGLLSGFLVALLLAAFGMYAVAVGGFISASLGTGFNIRRQYKSKSLQLFKERLEREGAIEVTISADQTWQENKSSFETITVSNRIYAVHQATLTEVLGKLPLNKKDVKLFTEAQRRVLDLAILINVVQDDGEILTTKQKKENNH